jgi:hypothetical protein
MSDYGAPKVTIEEWEKALVKRAAIDLYSCRECGSTAESPVVDCCDYCILKFHFEDADAPSLNTFRKEEVMRYLTGEGIHGSK